MLGTREIRTGAELFHHVQHVEQCLYGPLPDVYHNEVTSLCHEQWRALLIGVSTRPQHDYDELTRAGADVVWGKPPPPMNEHWRNQLVTQLVYKRQQQHQQALTTKSP